MKPDVLDRAVAGDERAFQELTDPYRAELQVHCYRMLGSLAEAEDMLQETLLDAWRGLDGFAGKASLRAWLYRIATNRCLNARRRRPPEPVPPFEPPEPSRRGEVTWLQPYPDAALGPDADYASRESVELAFIVTLQQLPPRQAAVVVLSDVLDFPNAEIADLLDTTPTAVKGALQRARARLAAHRDTTGVERMRLPESPAEREITARFAEAFAGDDIDGVIALLTDSAWLAMPPAPHEYHGRAAIAEFLRASTSWRPDRRFRLVPTSANTQPAFGCYLPATPTSHAYPMGLIVLTLRDNRIRGITHFLDAGLPRRFGLPEVLG